MALKEKTTFDYEIRTKFKHIQLRWHDIIEKDGKEKSRSYHRELLTPDRDLSGYPQEIQDIAGILWTQDVKDEWEEHNNTTV